MAQQNVKYGGNRMLILVLLATGIIVFQCNARRDDLHQIERTEGMMTTGPLGEEAAVELSNGDLAAAGQIYKFGEERNRIRIEGEGENVRVLKLNTNPNEPRFTVEMDKREYLQNQRSNHAARLAPQHKKKLPDTYFGVPVVRGGKRR